MAQRSLFYWMILGIVVLAGCEPGKGSVGVIGDSGTEADTDTDTDADTDVDTDTDTDTDTTSSGECADAGDCEPIYGAAPCGSWECNTGDCEVDCPGCVDADRDGYGPDAACAGPDCDDNDDAVYSDVAAQACYGGAPGTPGVGTCQEGTEECVAGAWTPCVGEVVPSGEACNDEDDDCDGAADEDLCDFACGIGACANTTPACLPGGLIGTCVPNAPLGLDNNCDGVDDDCDGAVDEHCVANCVWVTPAGDDLSADGTAGLPFSTIQSAIDFAVAPQFVCVAAGNNCGSNRTYNEDVGMRDGIHVYGGYESTNNTRCGSWNTRISPLSGAGVLFDATVQSTTVLDGFQIIRADSVTSAGVTVDGAVGALLSDLYIDVTYGALVEYAYSVDVMNGGDATIRFSQLYGGEGSRESVGVHSVGSTVHIEDNCDTYDAGGHCDSFCPFPWNGNNRGIQGRYQTVGPAGSEAFAVMLDTSPNSTVERNALCSHTGPQGATVRIAGDATGTQVRGNFISGFGGEIISAGIWLSDCDGAAPWIVDNLQITGEAADPNAEANGIRSVGDCHPVIDSNVQIAGGAEGAAQTTTGVYCGADLSGASDCAILGNLNILGSVFGHPPDSVGVRCDDDSCNRIANNVISGGGGVNVYGLWLQNSGTMVDDNYIDGGCGVQTSTGIYADDSYARIQNNHVYGGTCANVGLNGPTSWGMSVSLTASPNEVDVHSNFIDGGNARITCNSYGVGLYASALAAPTAPSGTWRNNIIRAGECTTNENFFEGDVSVDPRIFENNDLDPYGTPTAIYVDADTAPLLLATDVDLMADVTVSGTFSADPLFVNDPSDIHLQAGSACIAAGTAAGAPALDMDGAPRDLVAPDVGPDEF